MPWPQRELSCYGTANAWIHSYYLPLENSVYFLAESLWLLKLRGHAPLELLESKSFAIAVDQVIRESIKEVK